MFVGVNGVVFDDQQDVLLMLRDDTRTWSLPGGALERGELPPDGVAREIEEETGLVVRPQALAGIYTIAAGTRDLLSLSFLCKVTGGTMNASTEALKVRYFAIDSLPRSLPAFQRERIMVAQQYAGAPVWRRQVPSRWLLISWRLLLPLVYRWKDRRREWRGEEPYRQPPDWSAGAFVVIRESSGAVLWVKRRDRDVWNLPGGKSEASEPPWETAMRETKEETGLDVKLESITGIYVKPEEDAIIFTFSAEAIGGALAEGDESAGFAYFTPGSEPENCLPKQRQRVEDATGNSEQPVFRVQSGPPGLAGRGEDQEVEPV